MKYTVCNKRATAARRCAKCSERALEMKGLGFRNPDYGHAL
jgi:hypothetical protein